MQTADAVGWAMTAILCALMLTGFTRGVMRGRRQRRELKQRVQEAIAKITADGKVEGPKGKFVWKNWSRKWIRYANSLPEPRGDRRMPCTRDLPRYPHVGER